MGGIKDLQKSSAQPTGQTSEYNDREQSVTLLKASEKD